MFTTAVMEGEKELRLQGCCRDGPWIPNWRKMVTACEAKPGVSDGCEHRLLECVD